MSDEDGKAHRYYDPKDTRITVNGVDITALRTPKPGVILRVDEHGNETWLDNHGNMVEISNEQH